MKKRKLNKKGFTLIEVIVTLVLVGITAALAGMWLVSVVNGYIFTKMNANTVQKAQLAMTRLVREFSAIAVTSASGTGITYTRTDSALNPVTVVVSRVGNELKINENNTGNNTLTDRVSAFALAYCDSPDSTSCPSTWSSTSKIIEITLTLTGAENTTSTFVQRVAPRNI